MIKAIYKITNKINGKIYIGQSIRPKTRWWEHCQSAKNQRDNYPIHQAIYKYGEENFTFEILEWTANYDDREAELIGYYNSITPNGYNVMTGGPSPVMVGENNPRNTITDNAVSLIIEDLKDNMLTDREIARKYGTTDKIIADINHGRTHRVDKEQYPIRIKKGRQKLSEQEANQIKNLLLNSDLTFSEIAAIFKTTKNNISQINNGRNFKRDRDIYPIRTIRVKTNQFG